MKRLAISAAALLASCAANTPQQVREIGSDRQYTFEVKTDYQTAYRRILETARACYQTTIITASQTVSGDLYPDSKTGTVTIGMYGAFGPAIYQVIDVRGLDPLHAKVIATFPLGPVEKHGAKVKAWATATGADC